ncbi:phage virion morphogenesis protein [Catenovulum sediminis]|uniref:Phage virion morphogenesis protein n=1 Tax=Catenovulum sediminis TaxID=1740262 RepID=A0ABV1RCM9_9ALTE
MSNQIHVEHNSTAVIDILQRITDKTDDLTEAMQEVAATLEDAAEQAFKDERAPTGEPWEALSDNYLKQNPKRVGGQILQASGGLAASIESDYGSDWASVGSNKVYAAIHQFGGTPNMPVGPRNIPARPYLGLDSQSENDLLDILGEFLLDD